MPWITNTKWEMIIEENLTNLVEIFFPKLNCSADASPYLKLQHIIIENLQCIEHVSDYFRKSNIAFPPQIHACAFACTHTQSKFI